MSKLSRTHQDYWKQRLRKRAYKTKSGAVSSVPNWQVRICYRGREEWFNLNSSNQEIASCKARDIDVSLRAHGWDATLAKYKPDMLILKDDPSIGEFLEEIRTKTGLKDSTFHTYAKKFRTLVAGVMRIKSDSSKFDTCNDGYAKWINKIVSIKLNKITPAKVQAWKVRYLKDCEHTHLSTHR